MNAATEGSKVSLADANIEQIEQQALAEINAAAGDGGAKAGAGGAQDVSTASSGQSQEELEAAAKAKANGDQGGESDKDVNFAAMRTKLKHAEEENRRIAAENERLLAEHAAKQPDVKALVEEVDTKLTELADMFQDGDITWEDYQTQLKEANAQRAALIEEAAKANARQEITKEQREREQLEAQEKVSNDWKKLSNDFISAPRDEIDYTKDEAKFGTLNTIVKALAKDPDNADKDQQWYLDTAHAAVLAKFGMPAAKPGTSKDEPKPKEAAPFNSVGEIPGGIAPARNEVEQLDQLSGAALTNRFAGMTEKQIDAELAKLA